MWYTWPKQGTYRQYDENRRKNCFVLFLFFCLFVCLFLLARQELHRICILKSSFARFARAFSSFVHFTQRSLWRQTKNLGSTCDIVTFPHLRHLTRTIPVSQSRNLEPERYDLILIILSHISQPNWGHPLLWTPMLPHFVVDTWKGHW